MIRDTHTCCRALSLGAITTCGNDFGLSWPGFEHLTCRMGGERFNRLVHLNAAKGCFYLIINKRKFVRT